MICPRCKHVMKDDARFCPRCGLKLEKCPVCQQPIIPGSRFCTHCGSQLNPNHQESQTDGYYQPLAETPYQEMVPEEPETPFKDIEVSNKVNKKSIIIAVVIVIALSGLSYGYLKYGPKFSFGKETTQEEKAFVPETQMKISSSTAFSSYTANTNQNGSAYFDGKNLYVIDEGEKIIKMDADLNNRVTLVNTKSKYLNVVDNLIYFTNENNQLCSITTDGKDQKTIIAKQVFYTIIKDNKLYYQLDEDKESIHVYDLSTNKDTKINDRKSYNLNILDDKIYYSSNDGIYVVGIDGKGEEKLVSGEEFINIAYQDKKIYYCLTNQLFAYHTETKKIETLVSKDAQVFLNITDKYAFYLTSQGVIRYDLATKDTKRIYSGSVTHLYVVGDKLVASTVNSLKNNGYKIIMDFDGENQQRLLASDDGSFV